HYLGQGVSPEQLIRFALAQDVDLVIVGCKAPEEVEALVRAGESHEDLSEEQVQAILAPFIPRAREFAFYRGSLFKTP
ncbi:MAG: aldo/keto reductase, partial [Desulfovibrionales bacterium]|nr:aldo/keto reductase [Desulfovibrionales bacterium]